MSRIVLATMGSLGDLHPYLALALGLKARGHDVTLATIEAYRHIVEGEALRFHAVGPNLAPAAYSEELIERAHDLRNGTKYLLRELVLPRIEQMYSDLLAACRGADLFCIHPVLFAAPVVAEKLELRWVSIALAPCAFVSAYDPPVIPPLPWLHALRHLGPRPNQLAFDLLRRLTRSWMRPIDDLRAREGLAAAQRHPIHDGMFSPFGTIGLFSRLLGAPQPDWPHGARLAGFAFYDKAGREQQLDAELQRFLDAGPPPVVFTLGSSAVMSSGTFYQQSLDAVRRVGCRAVFLVGNDPRNLPTQPPPDSVCFRPYVPYGRLLPRAAAVVHSGGVGTTAHAMRAGVPMLVVPFTHDQPDNAFRATRLGIARTVPRARYTGRRAAANLRLLLQRPEYAARARAIAARIAHEDGVGEGCTLLEDVLTAPAAP
jgi:UDP:flavonoid glycosyltransferase YjiC (YdhE family)